MTNKAQSVKLQTSPQIKDKIQLSPNNESFFITQDKNFDYFMIDFDMIDFDEIHDILQECRELEKNVWNPKEEFLDYAGRCNSLLYALKDGKIAGFSLVSSSFIDNNYFLSLDETMVAKEFQKMHISLMLSILAIRIYYLRVTPMKDIRKVTMVVETANPRLMSQFYENRHIYSYNRNTFRPSDELINILSAYISKNNAKQVDEKHPFFLKERFNACHKNDKKNPKHNLSKEFQKIMPSDFDPVQRGDSLAFMIMSNRPQVWFLILLVMAPLFKSQILLNKRIGYFRKDRDFLSIDRSGVNRPRSG